ncbi:MAG: 50S ribosomal protein L11 methyltransferase [Desulfobacterales bacterium]|nr:50S ribosomal protein L11 methyltransferase [Pseudomonadota bacterium]MCG2772861.1 50S ribosomal protein L11 methyltransferase [Desulfobacterales bacterium]
MPPPEKLFIYEIEGRVYPPDDLTGADFLGCWREGDHSYLFFPRPMEAAVKAWVATQESARYSSESVMNYADWEGGQPLMKTSMAGFHLCPVWETPAPAIGEVVIRMEPGLAFGSGFHPTTRTCLTLLRRVYDTEAPRKVLDLGTGTGILALASLALGAQRVVAVEYNELAVRTCARNLKHNQRRAEVDLIQADARDYAHLDAGLTLANIHLDVLLDLLNIPEFLRKDWYIFSGILGTQLEVFCQRLKGTPLKEVETRHENMWFAVLARGQGRSP